MFGAINCKTVRPFTRKLPEFKFWWSGARATAIALVWGPEYRCCFSPIPKTSVQIYIYIYTYVTVCVYIYMYIHKYIYSRGEPSQRCSKCFSPHLVAPSHSWRIASIVPRVWPSSHSLTCPCLPQMKSKSCVRSGLCCAPKIPKLRIVSRSIGPFS